MDTKGFIIVFGSLAATVAMIFAGAMLKGPIGAGLLVVGIVGCMAWVIAAFYLANAMNSDI